MYGYHGFFYGRVLGVADCISLASPRRAKLAHSIAPPLQRKPTSLGFALGAAYGGHCGRIGVHPTRTLCHGWSESGAAVKPYRIKFCTAPGPSGPEGIKTRNRTLRAGNFAEGRRGILRKWGSGGGPAGAVRRPRDTPGGVLVPFSPRKKELAQRAKTCKVRRAESSRPTGVMAHGDRRVWDPPLRGVRQNTAEPDNGRGKPLPYGVAGKHSPAENRRRAESSRPTGVTAHGDGRVWDPPLRRFRQNTAEPDNGRGKPVLKHTALAGCPKKTGGKPRKIGGPALKKMKNTLDTHGGVDV